MTELLEGFRHQMVHAGAVNLHAVVGGKGPPLVLIHGFPQTWWACAGMMPRLDETNTVVAVDPRGAGHSDCPQGPYDKVTMAADVHGVMQSLGFERYAVCWHDIGAMVAVALACKHRRAVTRLAVLDASRPGRSGWEANSAKPVLWHFALAQPGNTRGGLEWYRAFPADPRNALLIAGILLSRKLSQATAIRGMEEQEVGP